MKQLRVAMIAGPWLRVPPKGYGGIEHVVADLIKGLQALDVAVELFGVSGSQPGCPVHAYYDEEQYKFMQTEFKYSSVPAAGHVGLALNDIARDGHYDIIHDHNKSFGPLALQWATERPAMPPGLHTIHGAFFTTEDTIAKGHPDYTPHWRAFSQAKRAFVVGISDFQMHAAPSELRSVTLPTVYNGIDLAKWPFHASKEDYFLTLARCISEKGIHIAANICDQEGLPLKIAGPVADLTHPKDVVQQMEHGDPKYDTNRSVQYFKQALWPIIKRSHAVEYIGNISGETRPKAIGRAKALLFPITWDEPFGLAVVEALACGTPVIAMRRGAMPELIQHGKNGFLADNEAEFRTYMGRVEDIDPAVCRQTVEKQFSSEVMAQAYLERYKEVIRRASKVSRVS